MKWYADVKLAWKVLSAPAVVILLLVVVAGLSVAGSGEDERNFETLDTSIVRPLADALTVKDHLSLFQARLLGLLTTAGNDKTVAEAFAAHFDALQGELKVSAAAIAAQSTEWERVLDRASVTALRTALKDYVEVVQTLGDNAKADLTYGVLLLSDTNARFEVLRQHLDGVVTGLEGRRVALARETVADSRAGRVRLAVLAAMAVILGLVIASWSARLIARPVVAMTAVMGRLAANDLSVTVTGADRHDELGAMARAVQVFRGGLIEADHLRGEREAARAAKDRRQAAMDRFTQDFGQTIAGVMASLTQSAEHMRGAAAAMSEVAGQTHENAAATANGSAESSRNLSAVAAAAEEMSSSIAEISKQVSGVTGAVHQAVDRASTTDNKVTGLAEAVKRIGEVVRLITDIATRTNLLALNATIEAARAGEAGKGFAIVAGEVKALATQTAKATEDIDAQIVAIRSATGEAVGAVKGVTQAISEINSVAAAIAAAVEEQAATTREIASSVQTVMRSAQHAAEAMQKVSAFSDRGQSTSRGVLSAADDVGRTADTLRGEVQHFLTAMAEANDTERRRYERISGAGE
jgi:methyl-accepting chemotaxis protein